MLRDTKRASPEIREGEAPAEPDLAWGSAGASPSRSVHHFVSDLELRRG